MKGYDNCLEEYGENESGGKHGPKKKEKREKGKIRKKKGEERESHVIFFICFILLSLITIDFYFFWTAT